MSIDASEINNSDNKNKNVPFGFEPVSLYWVAEVALVRQ